MRVNTGRQFLNGQLGWRKVKTCENCEVWGPLNALIISSLLFFRSLIFIHVLKIHKFSHLDTIISQFFLFLFSLKPESQAFKKTGKEERMSYPANSKRSHDTEKTWKRRGGWARQQQQHIRQHRWNLVSGSQRARQLEGGWGSEEEEYAKGRARRGNRT